MNHPHRPWPLRLVALALAVAGCAPMHRPADPPTARVAAVDAGVDAGLDALVSQGRALADHVGPDAARAIFADLDRRPDAYLDRIEARFVTPPPAPGYDSLLLAVPLWALRRHDDARVRRLAGRIVAHYRALAQRPARADDEGRERRLAERTAAMELLRDGVDAAMGPSWALVAASELTVGVAGAPDATEVLRVTRTCTCVRSLSCRARVVDGELRVEVRADPAAAAACSECNAVSTACSSPVRATGSVVVNGAARAVAG